MTDRTRSRRRFLAAGATGLATASAGCLDRVLDRQDGDVRFADGVDTDLRRRVEDVYDATVDVCGRELRDPVTVRVIDGESMAEEARERNWFGDSTFHALAHVVIGVLDDLEHESSGRFSGTYSSGDEVVTLVDFGDPIPDLLVAHELFHGIQYQNFQVAEWPWTFDQAGIDGRGAQWGIVEGAAKYVEDSYVEQCDRDPVGGCLLSEPEPTDLSEWNGISLLSFGPHMNGHEFAAALAARGGWEAIWDAHRSPPTHTGQVLRPEWYPDVGPDPVRVDVDPPDGWSILDRERLGMQALFVGLWLHGGLPEESVYVGPDRTAHVRSNLVRYRSGVTDAWRGDEFVGLEGGSDPEDGDELAGVWRIRWRDREAAEAGLAAFERRADQWGERAGDGTHRLPNGLHERHYREGRDTVLAAGTTPGIALALPGGEG